MYVSLFLSHFTTKSSWKYGPNSNQDENNNVKMEQTTEDNITEE